MKGNVEENRGKALRVRRALWCQRFYYFWRKVLECDVNGNHGLCFCFRFQRSTNDQRMGKLKAREWLEKRKCPVIKIPAHEFLAQMKEWGWKVYVDVYSCNYILIGLHGGVRGN